MPLPHRSDLPGLRIAGPTVFHGIIAEPQPSVTVLPHKPYTYRGSDFTRPDPAEPDPAEPEFAPARRHTGAPLADPEWLAADAPFSAPTEWHFELALEAS